VEWQSIVALISPIAVVIIGVLTYRRGSKGDRALNLATNIQTTFNAQQGLIDNLQEETGRLGTALANCDHKCETVLKEHRKALQLIDVLQKRVESHELTIEIQKGQIELLSRGPK
jgi:LPS O-antigen subunit length determinant protein (WzzB/FepE family)